MDTVQEGVAVVVDDEEKDRLFVPVWSATFGGCRTCLFWQSVGSATCDLAPRLSLSLDI